MSTHPLSPWSVPIMMHARDGVSICRLPPTLIPYDWVEERNLSHWFLHNFDERVEQLCADTGMTFECNVTDRLQLDICMLPDGGRAMTTNQKRSDQIESALFDLGVVGDTLSGTNSYPPCYSVDVANGKRIHEIESIKVQVRTFSLIDPDTFVERGIMFTDLPATIRYDIRSIVEQSDTDCEKLITLINSYSLEISSIRDNLNTITSLNLDMFDDQLKDMDKNLKKFTEYAQTVSDVDPEWNPTFRLMDDTHGKLRYLNRLITSDIFLSMTRITHGISVFLGLKLLDQSLEDFDPLYNAISFMKNHLENMPDGELPGNLQKCFITFIEQTMAMIGPLSSFCNFVDNVKQIVSSLRAYEMITGIPHIAHIPPERRINPYWIRIMRRMMLMSDSNEIAEQFHSLLAWMIGSDDQMMTDKIDIERFVMTIVELIAPEGNTVGVLTEESNDNISNEQDRQAQIEDDHRLALEYLTVLFELAHLSPENANFFTLPTCHEQSGTRYDDTIDYSHEYQTVKYKTHAGLGSIDELFSQRIIGLLVSQWDLERLCLMICFEKELPDDISQMILNQVFASSISEVAKTSNDTVIQLLLMAHFWLENIHNLNNCLDLDDSIAEQISKNPPFEMLERAMLTLYRGDPEKYSRLKDHVAICSYRDNSLRYTSIPRGLLLLPIPTVLTSIIAAPSLFEEDWRHEERYPLNHIRFDPAHHTTMKEVSWSRTTTPEYRYVNPQVGTTKAIQFHWPLLQSSNEIFEANWLRKMNSIISTLYRRGLITDEQQEVLYRQIEQTGRFGITNRILKPDLRWLETKSSLINRVRIDISEQ
jgi:hypothetical protein